MTLSLLDKWIWDFWIAKDGSNFHIFYLQAPKDIKEERLRHWNVSIGHAVSQDLIHWEILPDALAPSPLPGTWDNCTTWTGSVIHHASTWYLFYTGSTKAEKGLVQRIGLATSSDLVHWNRHPGSPLIEADARWYETLDLKLWHDQAWRDPWVFEHNNIFHAYVTARANSGETSARGVIGHARSTNLIDWEVLPPVSEPGEFGYLEVPQLVQIQNRWYLLFSVSCDKYSTERMARPAMKRLTGTHYLVADSPFGPFRLPEGDFLAGDETGSYYSGKILQNHKGDYVYIAAHLFGPQNQFYGEIIDPLPVIMQADGKLCVSRSC